jgi:hypothetical protein
MISHEHKCIFVHISRTGGSSIERTIFKKDWWLIDPATKHLTASKTKDYTKITGIRILNSLLLETHGIE